MTCGYSVSHPLQWSQKKMHYFLLVNLEIKYSWGTSHPGMAVQVSSCWGASKCWLFCTSCTSTDVSALEKTHWRGRICFADQGGKLSPLWSKFILHWLCHLMTQCSAPLTLSLNWTPLRIQELAGKENKLPHHTSSTSCFQLGQKYQENRYSHGVSAWLLPAGS